MPRRHSVDFVRHELDNPLFSHYDEIDDAAKAFAVKIGADEQLCIKAARIACDPPTWDSVDDLSETEKIALRDERSRGFWHQPKSLRVTIITLCFSAVVQGWIQSVSNGSNQTMPEYFRLKHDETGNHEWVSQTAIWRFAAINAITYLTAGVFGCWFSDPLQASILGRRGAIFASACLCIIASIGAASVSRSWWHLLIWKAILGLGLGAKASVTPIFGAEVSPAHLRGMLVMNWQLFDALGAFGGFSANLIFYWTDRLAWRFQIASACIPAGALIVLIWTIPESPRWLLKKGRGDQAFISLCALRQTPLQAATELFFANAQIQRELKYIKAKSRDIETPFNCNETTSNDEKGKGKAHVEDIDVQDFGQFEKYHQVVAQTSYWSRIIQLFRNPRTRRAAVAACVVMLGQQLCGVNVLAFYSTIFIQNINDQTTKSINALWLSWGLFLANFVFTFPAYWWIDRYGRRFLLLATYPGMILSLFATCLSFLASTDSVRRALVSLFIFTFILFYSLGQGPVAFAYASEVFPLFNRESGMSLAVFVNLFGAGLLTLFVPQAQVSISTFTTHPTTPSPTPQQTWLSRQALLLGAFTILCTTSMALIYFFVPETKLATVREDPKRTLNYISLEELNQIFTVRTRDCWRYYIYHVAMGRVHNFLLRCSGGGGGGGGGVRGGMVDSSGGHDDREEEQQMRKKRREPIHIEDSMHFWSKNRLDRKKKEEEEKEKQEQRAEEKEKTKKHKEGGRQSEEDERKAEGEREEKATTTHSQTTSTALDPSTSSTTTSTGAIETSLRAHLPTVTDTGGSLNFLPTASSPSPSRSASP